MLSPATGNNIPQLPAKSEFKMKVNKENEQVNAPRFY